MQNQNKKSLLEEAFEFHKQGKYLEAIKTYEEVIKIEPNNYRAIGNLGSALRSIGKKNEAIELLKKACELAPNDINIVNNYANSLHDSGNLKEAEVIFKKAIEISKRGPMVLANYASLLYELGRFDESIRIFEEAFKANQNFSPAQLNNYGRSLFKLQKNNEAIHFFTEAIKKAPNFQDPYVNAATCHRMAGNKEQAMVFYNEIVKRFPSGEIVDKAKYWLAALTGQNVSAPPADYVARLFDGYAENFDEHLVKKLAYKAPNLIFQILEKNIKLGGLEILDLGCGTGLCGEILAKYSRRLVGVDLSKNMVEKARDKYVYSELEVAEIQSYLENEKRQYDLVTAADVFCYFGDMEKLFSLSAKVIKQGGHFAFSLEKNLGEENFKLLETGRFSHKKEYVESLAKINGFSNVKYMEEVLRFEKTSPINGHIFLFKKN